MTSSLHALLESAGRVIALGVVSFADLVLLHLADVAEFIHDGVPTLIDDMDGESLLRLVLTESLQRVHELPNNDALSVLELKAHICRVGSELALEELLALLDVPILIKTKLGHKSFHSLV